jgi:hypothetical protein
MGRTDPQYPPISQPTEVPLSAKALARQFGCAVSSIHRMARLGIIPSMLVGPRCGTRRYFPSAVREALERLSLKQQVIVSKRRSREDHHDTRLKVSNSGGESRQRD